MAGMRPGVSVGLERQGSQLPVYKRAPSPEITASPVHLQQIPKVLRGAAASSTPRRTAVKSGKMQRNALLSKMPQIESLPSEPGSLLIWTHGDVAAEHHKGAAYQHRCYLCAHFTEDQGAPSARRVARRRRWIQIKDISGG